MARLPARIIVVCTAVLTVAALAIFAFHLIGDSGSVPAVAAGRQDTSQTSPSLVATPLAATPSATVYANAPGIPAITPHETGATSGARFTEADVIAYFQKSGEMHADSTQPVTVAKVQFLTVAEATKQLDWGYNRSPDALVCIVTLHGHFSVDGPPGYPARVGSTDYVIFDGTTGNLLGDSVQVSGVAQ